MQKIKRLMIIMAMFVLAMPTAIFAGPPMPPIYVYGTVTIDSNTASNGTVSVAGVSSNIQSDGTYSIKIPFENVDLGVEYTYKVNQTNAVTQEITGPTQEVNLSITTASEPAQTSSPAPANTGGGYSPAPTTPTIPATPAAPTPPAVEEVDETPVPEPEDNEEEEVVVLGVGMDYRTMQINRIMSEAGCVWKGDADLAVQSRNRKRNHGEETEIHNRYVARLTEGMGGLMESNINAFTNFILYSTETTDILGAGERAGILNSYKSAFGKLPATEEEWQDVLKIGNGRWPNQRSETAENNAKKEFKKVYKRSANMENANDDAAITVMAYGLRPDVRNLNNEKAGIKSFKHIYGYNPSSAVDWDIVRAIAYSGAVR